MERLPKHVAIIMDGNGRWAKKRNMPRAFGHEAGAKAVRKVIEASASRGIEILTLFAFGVENWQRPKAEVNSLMHLFFKSLKSETAELHNNNILIRFLGDTTAFDSKLQKQMDEVQRLTATNTGLKLVVAVNYSGRWDLVQGMQQIGKQIQLGELEVDQISETVVESFLTTADLPPPDLFIRTSGEQRISNFYLWQLAYTELYFTDILWPDFNEWVFEDALTFYASRQRRFGRTAEQLIVG